MVFQDVVKLSSLVIGIISVHDQGKHMRTRQGHKVQRNTFRLAVISCTAAVMLAGCANTTIRSGTRPHLQPQSSWTVLPFVNNTATPYAGKRAQYLAASLLGTLDLSVQSMPTIKAQTKPLDLGQHAADLKKELSWARGQHIRYALMGSVEEWRYQIGLSGRPAVGLTLRLLDVKTGQVIWTAAGSATGPSGTGLAATAQNTLSKLLRRLIP